MTDSNDDDRGPPRGRPQRGRPGGDRPFGARRDEGDRPPRRPRPDGERKPRFDRARDDRRPEERPEAEAPEPSEERIAKVIARAGVASRRDAEVLIADGRVTLNGEVLASPAVNVTPTDAITVDGEPLPAKERTRLWIFHKPRGLVTTARDPEGRPTVFESLPEDMPRAVAVGRLDINTEGLLLLTNDGGLARTIAHPDTGWLRRYKVRAHGEITQADLDRLRDGITIDGIEYGPIEARLDRVQGDNLWITLGLREGKNREIKRILEHLGLQVNRLIRLSFGPFQLGDLEPGLVEEVKTKVLKEQLGQKLAEEAGVDFTSPVREPIAPFGSKPRQDQGERGASGRPSSRGQDRARGEDRARDDRPRRDRDGERPRQAREDRPDRGRRDEGSPSGRAPRERAAHATERRETVWRAEEPESGERKRGKVPRRGLDPKEARAASAERQHQRVGAIETGEGRKVVVERLVSEPRPERERPARRSRDGSPQDGRLQDRSAPGGDDQPRRRADRDTDRPSGERPSTDRPLRDRPPGRPRDDAGRGRPDAGRGRPYAGRGRPGRDAAEGERPPRRFSRDESSRPERDRTPARGAGPGGPGAKRSFGARSSGERSSGERPSREQPSGERPFRGRSREDGSRRGPGGDGRADGPRRGPGGSGPKGPRGGPRSSGPGGSGPRSPGPRGSGPRGSGPRGSGPKGPARDRRT